MGVALVGMVTIIELVSSASSVVSCLMAKNSGPGYSAVT